MSPHRCLAGCGKAITWQFAICSECEKTYGTSPYTWPEWLRFLWSATLKERRREKKRQQFEVPLDFQEPFDDAGCAEYPSPASAAYSAWR